MNKQRKDAQHRGIEWTDYTWNPTGGCLHGCTWQMPDGSVTQCYAKTVAEGLAQSAYPHGFEHHYWREGALEEPLKLKDPAKIFVGSMADLFGHWVPEAQIHQVLDVMQQADWHTFQTLSKYPVRLPDFNPFPPNVWVGVSLPAGRQMSQAGAARALTAYLRHMTRIDAEVRFMSVEPLWFDAGQVFEAWADEHGSLPFEWIIIGAATNGRAIYQPDPVWVKRLLAVVDRYDIPVFFKGNLTWSPWREVFPGGEPTTPPHKVTLYTTRISPAHVAECKRRGVHFVDTTVASATWEGKPFAPTWEMVNGIKSGLWSEQQYTEAYLARMRESYANPYNRPAWEALLRNHDAVALGCYCAPGAFCHRYLLADILKAVGEQMGLVVEMGGEIEPSQPERTAPEQLALFSLEPVAVAYE